jgi:hypothetical protein
MGNRGLTRALAAIVVERPDLRGRFREIILAAPGRGRGRVPQRPRAGADRRRASA